MARTTKPAKTKPHRTSGGATAARASKQRKPGAGKRKPSLDELVADLVFDGPGDLSTNPKHMQGFGQPNRPVQAVPPRPANRKSLAKLFAESPLKGLDLKLERD
jgi:hypothetical protein